MTISTGETHLHANYIIGVDLGQVQDYTALCVLEHVWGQDVIEWQMLRKRDLPDEQVRYNILHLERFPLGMPYPQQMALIKERMEALPDYAKENDNLAVDATGVGRAVVDLMYASGLYPTPITITAGDRAIYEAGWRVPKRDLVSTLQVLMQQRKLKVAEGLPEAATLVREMQNFRYKINLAGNDSYEAWRENAHDDLVLAVAIACWMANRFGGIGVYF